MSDSKGNNKGSKRNLPSWMSSREEETGSSGKDQSNVEKNEESNEGEEPKQAKQNGKLHIEKSIKETKSRRPLSASGSGNSNSSKLLDGVVFVLSGFVNPERGTLRSQALEMGAEFQADWNSECTMLICAFPNTPKFRQVEMDNGTIVSKEWISECYKHKKLVDIERYLMHTGKPWRKSGLLNESSDEPLAVRKTQEQVEKESNSKKTDSSSSKNGASKYAQEQFSPFKVKKWVIDDLNKTVSWLESQEEKPEQSEIKNIAAEGILTCIQDAIDTLKLKQDIRQVTEQWGFIPRAVEELGKLDGDTKGSGSSSNSNSKEELHKQAMSFKRIYEVQLKSIDDDDSTVKTKKAKSSENDDDRVKKEKGKAKDALTGYDSDETIEMTEEEINLADKSITSKC